MTTPPRNHGLSHEHFAQSDEEQVDPHGFSKGHTHGHVVLSTFTLRMVLGVLLSFTVLTVFFAQGEKWVDATFDVTLPHWVNVVVAMSIATVKSIVVALFFMQLKYDNPINSAVFMFCLLALGLFMGFTALDLGMRDRVYAFKAGEIVQGGTGGIQKPEVQNGKTVDVTVNMPLYKFAAEQLKERVGPKEFDEIRAEVMAHGHHGPARAPKPTGSTPDQSRPRDGITPGLFDATAPHADPHAPHSTPPTGGGEHTPGH